MPFKLKTKLRDYYKLQKKVQALDSLGEEANNQELFDLEEEIENYFHLPNNYTPLRDEIQIASFEYENVIEYVKQVSVELIRIAEIFFKSNALTDTEIINRAISELDTASNVFPLINCPMTAYSMFLYYKLLLKKKLAISDFISIIPKLNLLSVADNFLFANMNEHPCKDNKLELLKCDLPFINDFIEYTFFSKEPLENITEEKTTDENFISTFQILDVRFLKEDNEIIILPIIDFFNSNKSESAITKFNEFEFKNCLLNATDISFFELLIPMFERFKNSNTLDVSYQLYSLYADKLIIDNYPIYDYAILD